MDFKLLDLSLIGLIFVWTGFVRSGLGFGGAALGLPLMLFIHPQPLYWLPIIGTHLLFFISLTGAPLMVTVFMRNVASHLLRNTLFVLWFVLVSIKMTAFAARSVKLNFAMALYLLPVAAIGHVIGLRSHQAILRNDRLFKRLIGGVLIVISLLGLAQIH